MVQDVGEAMRGADSFYADVWLAMGKGISAREERIRRLTPYRVTREGMASGGNPHATFMHCLPGFHNNRTDIEGDIFKRFGIDCMEMTDDAVGSAASVGFDKAETVYVRSRPFSSPPSGPSNARGGGAGW